MKTIGEYQVSEKSALSKVDLKEGQVYSIPYLSHKGIVLVNECLYAVIDGSLKIHRSANWENVPTTDLSKSAFLKELDLSELPDDLVCFCDQDKMVG